MTPTESAEKGESGRAAVKASAELMIKEALQNSGRVFSCRGTRSTGKGRIAVLKTEDARRTNASRRNTNSERKDLTGMFHTGGLKEEECFTVEAGRANLAVRSLPKIAD